MARDIDPLGPVDHDRPPFTSGGPRPPVTTLLLDVNEGPYGRQSDGCIVDKADLIGLTEEEYSAALARLAERASVSPGSAGLRSTC